ncbi:siphovirus Gp157 family protein [Geminocystis sp.]|uniref:siphovirus Gp157 family protein n=1 Tax=Geminocystis sp. TaxID=2664100 RepID=UPI0035931544
MTETKGTYKLYELGDRLNELEQTIENLEGVDIPADLHLEYLELLEEADETNNKFIEKIDSILSLIQSRKRWLEIRKAEADRLTKLVRKDEKAIDWLQEYLKKHLEKIGKTKLRTNKFNVSIRKASIAPLQLLRENAKDYPPEYQKITVEIDKKALRKAVTDNEKIALKYGCLGEKSTYLSIK